MSNSTDTYWDINGVSLQTYAYNVQTIASKFGSPKLRGSDRQFAYRHGMKHRPRKADVGAPQLQMWVIGQNLDGSVPANREVEFNENVRRLANLFTSVEGEEFELTKRWHDNAGLNVVTGRAICPDGLGINMEGGPYRAKFSVEFLMADPFYYAPPVVVPIPINTDTVVTVPGDAPAYDVQVEFIGQLSNPKLTNSTPAPNVWLKVGTAIASGDAVTVDSNEAVVVRQNDDANLIGALSHSGARAWFPLKKGVNTLRLTADSGAGSAILTFRPAFF